jgi:predicted RNase H-like HicB family nuclease
MMRQVIVYRGEDGFWVSECPSLPGCISQGMAREEAIRNIQEAIDLYTDALEEDELPVPEERILIRRTRDGEVYSGLSAGR